MKKDRHRQLCSQYFYYDNYDIIFEDNLIDIEIGLKNAIKQTVYSFISFIGDKIRERKMCNQMFKRAQTDNVESDNESEPEEERDSLVEKDEEILV